MISNEQFILNIQDINFFGNKLIIYRIKKEFHKIVCIMIFLVEVPIIFA